MARVHLNPTVTFPSVQFARRQRKCFTRGKEIKLFTRGTSSGRSYDRPAKSLLKKGWTSKSHWVHWVECVMCNVSQGLIMDLPSALFISSMWRTEADFAPRERTPIWLSDEVPKVTFSRKCASMFLVVIIFQYLIFSKLQWPSAQPGMI